MAQIIQAISYCSPDKPKVSPNFLASSVAEKRALLREILLANFSDAKNISLDTPTVPNSSLQFPSLTTEIVKSSIHRAGNKPPGPNELPTSILRHAWPLIKDDIFALFSRCPSLGYHPICFHRAVVVIFKDSKTLNLSLPRSYQSAPLLSVLGKGLERL